MKFLRNHVYLPTLSPYVGMSDNTRLSLTKINRKRAERKQSGKSMIEMLGVLAIVGVLSIGAIAGYQKAMFQHKLNKHAVAVNFLINYSLQIKDKLEFEKNKVTYFNELYLKLNLIPDGIRYQNKSTLLDLFNNKIMIYHNNQKFELQGIMYQNNFGGIGFSFDPTPAGLELCKNIVFAAKENSANLWLVETYKYYHDSSQSAHGHKYGDLYCSNNSHCLRNLTFKDIEKLCQICDEKTCQLFVLWK